MKNKNILIIMPKFYAYQSKMKEDLEGRGQMQNFMMRNHLRLIFLY